MVGIVVVSHSPALAQAAVALALEMVPSGPPPVAVAAGGPGGVTGTDAVAVSEAIGQVGSPDGVLVLMDLGSAVLSAELALEFLDDPDIPVRLTSAPFVEGLMAAVVSAAGGASLDVVAREARGALAAKAAHLEQEQAHDEPALAATSTAQVTRDLQLINPVGMHARPAALLVAALGGLDAEVTVANTRTGRPPVAVTGTTALLTIDGRNGDTLRFGASGADAQEALNRIADLVHRGFDELDVSASPAGPARPATAAPAEAETAVPGRPLGVSPGRGVGPVVRMADPVSEPSAGETVPADGRDAEADRITAAAAAVAAELRARAARVKGEAAAILEANALMAEDRGLLDDARARVLELGLAAAPAAWHRVPLSVDPGISAMQAAAARAGAPLGHDFCAISLSDNLKPWEVVLKRLRLAAEADFVIALYNPISRARPWQLGAAFDALRDLRSVETPVILAQAVGRPDEALTITTLGAVDAAQADMRTCVIIGASHTRLVPREGAQPWVYTPRSYGVRG